jgi:hypothetical protein
MPERERRAHTQQRGEGTKKSGDDELRWRAGTMTQKQTTLGAGTFSSFFPGLAN